MASEAILVIAKPGNSFSTCCSRHTQIIRSSILPIVSSMHNSRYELDSPAGLLGFCRRTKRSFFHILEKAPSRRHCIYICVNRLMYRLYLMAIFKRLLGIPSRPDISVLANLSVTFMSSLSVTTGVSIISVFSG